MVYGVKIADEICGVIAIPDTARRPEKFIEEAVVRSSALDTEWIFIRQLFEIHFKFPNDGFRTLLPT